MSDGTVRRNEPGRDSSTLRVTGGFIGWSHWDV